MNYLVLCGCCNKLLIIVINKNRFDKAMDMNGYNRVCVLMTSLAMGALQFALPADALEMGTGQKIFAENCSVCHGDRGDKGMYGNRGLNPSPRNFTDDKARQELSRERMLYSVTHGRPGTAMIAWGKKFSAEEIEQVVDYVRDDLMFPMGEHKWHMEMGMDMSAGGAMQEHDHNAHWDSEDIAKPMPFR